MKTLCVRWIAAWLVTVAALAGCAGGEELAKPPAAAAKDASAEATVDARPSVDAPGTQDVTTPPADVSQDTTPPVDTGSPDTAAPDVQQPPADTGAKFAITAIFPATGVVEGGTLVAIVGSGLSASMTVTIGGAACTGVAFTVGSMATCTTGAHSAGNVNVVATSGTDTSTLTGAFTYAGSSSPVLGVTLVSPATGPIDGGTVVAVFGSAFEAGMTITIGGVPCTGVALPSSSQATCTTGAHLAGVVDVKVTIGAASATLTGGFTYTVPTFTITAVFPSTGVIQGGTTIQLVGTYFGPGMTVDFDGLDCGPITVNGATSATCVTPPHAAATVDVHGTRALEAGSQTSTLTGGFTYSGSTIPPLAITGIFPTSGVVEGGTTITLTGTHFGPGMTVDLGGVACGFVLVANDVTATCITPASTVDAGAVDVHVHRDFEGGTPEDATLAGGFTYYGSTPFTLASIFPTYGKLEGGTHISLFGQSLVPGMTVTIGGVPCTPVTILSATQAICYTGPHAEGTVDVVASPSAGVTATLPNAYTYVPVLSLASVVPISGSEAGGQAMTLTGTGFVSGASVSIGGTDCGSVQIVSSTTLKCTTGAKAPGLYSITVTNPGNDTATLSNAYRYFPSAGGASNVDLVAGQYDPHGSIDSATATDVLYDSPGDIVKVAASFYVLDRVNCVIRQVDAATGATTTLAGLARSCSAADGTAGGARFTDMRGMAADSTYLYVTGNCAVRKVEIATGAVSTVAGVTGTCAITDATGASARFSSNMRGAIMVGTLLHVCDDGQLRTMDTTSGAVATVNNNASCRGPLATDGTYFYTVDNNVIKRCTAPSCGGLADWVGDWNSGAADGTLRNARFNGIQGMWYDATSASLYIADQNNHAIRQIVVATGVTTTFAGALRTPGVTDGATGVASRFYMPSGLIGDGTNLYVTSQSQDVRAVAIANGATTFVSGASRYPYGLDGLGLASRNGAVRQMVTDGTYVYFADRGSWTVRRLDPTDNQVTTVAGYLNSSGSVDGAGTAARFFGPRGLVYAQGWLFVGDGDDSGDNNCKVRKIDLSQTPAVVSTFSGGASCGHSDATGTAATHRAIQSLTTDGTYLYTAETYWNGPDQNLRKIEIATGVVTSVGQGNWSALWWSGTTLFATAENGGQTSALYTLNTANGNATRVAGAQNGWEYGCQDGAASTARFGYIRGIVGDGTYLYLTDSRCNAIRRVKLSDYSVTTIAGSLSTAPRDLDGTLATALFYAPVGIVTTTQGTYIGNGYGIRLLH